jgi:glyoxylase-like metal-dependent hydrolase (beta-lactamase superfamily II)
MFNPFLPGKLRPQITRRLLLLIAILCPAAAAIALEPTKVAPNVYAFIGASGEIVRANKGRIGNAGFLVGPTGVVVVDTGVSYRHASEMLSAIRKVTREPIRAAIITHAHQEFLFGNALLRERGAKLIAHDKTAALIRSRCENCLKLLKQAIGAREMHGSKVVAPETLVDATTTITEAGLELQLIHPGWAATPGDLAVFDRASGVLFAGALIDVERVPELRDAKLKAWIDALPTLRQLPIELVVPGHGPVAGPAAVDAMLGYLKALEAKTRALYDQGLGLAEATAAGDLPEYQPWNLYAEQHHRNVHRAYLQIEEEDLQK